MLPNFRSTVTRYLDECSHLSDRIAILMAKGIGKSETMSFLQNLRENHTSYLRVVQTEKEIGRRRVAKKSISRITNMMTMTGSIQEEDRLDEQSMHSP